VSAAVTAAVLGCAPASAQVDAALLGPVVASDFTAPTYFDGLYVGALYGSSGADHKNFFPTGSPDRTGVGAALGWNTYLGWGVVAGAELQGWVDSDFMGAWSLSAFALGRVGLTTADDFLVYVVGGGGVFDSVPAYAFGAGFEWGLFNALSLRYELLAVSQAVEANGVFRPGVTAWRLGAGLLWHLGEGAQDIPGLHLGFDRPANVTDFGGLYYGAYFGGQVNSAWNFFPDQGHGLHMTRADLGGIVGYNYRLLDSYIVAGVEGQGGILFDTSGDVSYNVLGLAKLGVVPFEGLFVYGAGGVGIIQDKPAFAAGGGAEYALWGDASVRAEVLAYGEASAAPEVPGFSGTKLSVGAIWRPE
jgi:hypothetical protein